MTGRRRLTRRALLAVGATSVSLATGVMRRPDDSERRYLTCCDGCTANSASGASETSRTSRGAPSTASEASAGSEANEDADRTVESGNHWLAFAWAKHDEGFGRFEARFRVPCEPKSTSGRVVFFYFPALQSYGGEHGPKGYILQPVIAWNWGGSRRWEMATWYGSTERGFEHSPLVPVSPGDELRAVVDRPDELPGRWHLQLRNRSTGDVVVQRSHELGGRFRYAYLTLEASRVYAHGRCSLLPNGTDFHDVVLESWDRERRYPRWKTRYDGRVDCDFDLSVRGPDWVRIRTSGSRV